MLSPQAHFWTELEEHALNAAPASTYQAETTESTIARQFESVFVELPLQPEIATSLISRWISASPHLGFLSWMYPVMLTHEHSHALVKALLSIALELRLDALPSILSPLDSGSYLRVGSDLVANDLRIKALEDIPSMTSMSDFDASHAAVLLACSHVLCMRKDLLYISIRWHRMANNILREVVHSCNAADLDYDETRKFSRSGSPSR
jgi:hypothetical protein